MGVTVQQVRRLAQAGEIHKVGRGLVSRESVERYLASGRRGRTRAWAEHTAWGAIALLVGVPAEWLTSSQASRVRSALWTIRDPRELVTRTRDRATTRTYSRGPNAETLLRERLLDRDLPGPRLVGTRPGDVDGYLAADELPRIARILQPRHDPAGPITLRATTFDIDRVREIAGAGPVLAALDAAMSADLHVRTRAERVLSLCLAQHHPDLNG